ncbi:uncharacterized protein LOC134279047 [Saccostrea cucullata]|uniref:uncharacterized protein LOC134279047 n=1 Tax=Saccostrea cuccullata TaxID=36930 RepID=UPI002ED136D4
MNTWIWASLQTSISHYTGWSVGEPNNKLHDESCIELNHMKHYQWNDERCTEHNYFICEQPDASHININKPNIPHVPTTTKNWLTLQTSTTKPPYVPPINSTPAITTVISSTTPPTTTNSEAPPTTKRLQFVTLPRNQQNSLHMNGSNPQQIVG